MSQRIVQVLVFLGGVYCGMLWEAMRSDVRAFKARHQLREARFSAMQCTGMVADHWLTAHGEDPRSLPIILQAEELHERYEALLEEKK